MCRPRCWQEGWGGLPAGVAGCNGGSTWDQGRGSGLGQREGRQGPQTAAASEELRRDTGEVGGAEGLGDRVSRTALLGAGGQTAGQPEVPRVPLLPGGCLVVRRTGAWLLALAVSRGVETADRATSSPGVCVRRAPRSQPARVGGRSREGSIRPGPGRKALRRAPPPTWAQSSGETPGFLLTWSEVGVELEIEVCSMWLRGPGRGLKVN